MFWLRKIHTVLGVVLHGGIRRGLMDGGVTGDPQLVMLSSWHEQSHLVAYELHESSVCTELCLCSCGISLKSFEKQRNS